jgi:two-component system chemotaxis sensor kinase CheA
LVDLPRLLTGVSSPQLADGELKQVVVYSTQNGSCGFVVDRILDIVQDTVNLQLGSSRPGVKGSAIIQKQVTDMLDLDAIIATVAGLRSPSENTQGAL